MTPLDAELVKRFNDAIKIEDAKAVEHMANGGCRDFVSYREMHSRRRALEDARKLLDEIFDDLMKE